MFNFFKRNKKPQVIRDLEREFGFELYEEKLNDIWKYKSFSKNENGEVIGLNLHRTEIKDLTPLSALTTLQTLSLKNTRVNDLSALSGLINLKMLNLSDTRISDISVLSGLTNLTELNLNGIRIGGVFNLSRLNSLIILDFSNIQQSNVIMLSELISLQTLDFSNSQIENLHLNKLKNLITLNLLRAQVTNLQLNNLDSLTELELSRYTAILNLSGLNNLTELDLSNTQVTNLQLSNSNSLIALKLNNHLTTLKLSGLDNLTELDLSNTQVTNLELSSLNSLTTLKLNNRIATLKLSGLDNLTELDLSNTLVIDIVSLKHIINLTELNLSGTLVSDIAPLKSFNNLKKLWLTETQVSDISILSELDNLIELSLSNTQVSNISNLSTLNNLEILDIRNCSVKNISLEIAEKFEFAKWKDELQEGLNLYGNPVQNFLPPEIINQGQKAIIKYLKVKEDNKQLFPLNEVKTLIIGSGGSGKTSLMRRLIGQEFNPKEDQTHGIRIIKHEIEYNDKEKTVIDVHFWDFGGQEINHATHQFFYSKRSLYLLVLDARQDDQAEYWLKYIENLGGDSPILVVLNKIDENPTFEVNRRFLLEKYSNIKAFHRVSCRTCEGIEELQRVMRSALYYLEFRKMELAPSWFAVKEALTNMKENYISYDRYFEICREGAITEPTAQEVLRELIHDLGLALDFKKLRRYDKQVLNPKWITKGVYRIINSPEIGSIGKGVLQFEMLNNILHDWARYDAEDDQNYRYPEHTHPYITGIMQEFELCYELGNDEYIVPDLLPVQEPPDLDYDAHPLHFVIRYEDLLPRSVMPRFMVKMHRLIPSGPENRWRTGVVLQGGIFEANAIIRADNEEKEIHVWTRGKDARRMLSFIRGTFKEIQADFEKLDVSEWLVIQEKNDKQKKKAVLVKYSTLLAYEDNNRDLYFCPELEEDFKVADLLNGIETPESREEVSKIRAFISYAEADEQMKDTFKDFIRPLTYEFGLEIWDKQDVTAGTFTEQEIQHQINSSQLIFMLVSANLMADVYFWQTERLRAIRRHEQGQSIVVPIILRPCMLDGMDFMKLHALPSDKKPVTKWENQDSAWLDAAKQIRKLLQSERLEGLRRQF